MPVGRSVTLTAVTKQSARAIFGHDQRAIAADHDLNAEKVIPSVTLCTNITETLKQRANFSTVVGQTDLAVFLSRSRMKPLIVQLDFKKLQMCTRS